MDLQDMEAGHRSRERLILLLVVVERVSRFVCCMRIYPPELQNVSLCVALNLLGAAVYILACRRRSVMTPGRTFTTNQGAVVTQLCQWLREQIDHHPRSQKGGVAGMVACVGRCGMGGALLNLAGRGGTNILRIDAVTCSMQGDHARPAPPFEGVRVHILGSCLVRETRRDYWRPHCRAK